MARNYTAEYNNYHASPEQKRNRAMRNAARKVMERKGVVKKGDGKDVDHKMPIAKGGGNGKSNLRALPAGANRSFPRTKGARMR